MFGPSLYAANGVVKRVKLAEALKRRRSRIIGHDNGSDLPATLEARRTYRWNCDNLKKLIAEG